MDEEKKAVAQIAHSLNRRIIRDKILAHRVPEILDEELKKHKVPDDRFLAVRLEVDELARRLRIAALRKRLA